MATLVNRRTGESLPIDVSGSTLSEPAEVARWAVEDGLDPVSARQRMAGELQAEVLLADIAAVGDPREQVTAWIEEAARRADRLAVVIPGMRTLSDYMIGGRQTTPDTTTTSTRVRVMLHEVTFVSTRVGEIEQPQPRPDLRPERAQPEDAGQQTAGEPERIGSLARRFVGGDVAGGP